MIFDLGLVRDLGYYTGAIFEVYDPALGHVIGGGGRYDDLLGRFGRAAARPAASRLFVERLHVAQAEEERRARRAAPVSEPLRLAVPRGALFEETLDLLDAIGVDTRAAALGLALAAVPGRAR